MQRFTGYSSMMSGVVVLSTVGDKFRLEMERAAGCVILRPVGLIDEDVNFLPLLPEITHHAADVSLQFDLGSVSRINSSGIREWLIFMEHLAVLPKVQFFNLNEICVEYGTLMPQMFGSRRGAILSVQAPYHCDRCGTPMTVLVQTDQVKFVQGAPSLPVYTCPKCAGPLAFDSVETEYLDLLKR